MSKRIFIGVLILVLVGILAYVYVRYNQPEKGPDTNIDEDMQVLLAEKYDKPLEEVRINRVRQKDDFASGSVLFGEPGPGAGGVFLAKRVKNKWEIVFDGNGSVDCDAMRGDFGFPDEILVPNFCD